MKHVGTIYRTADFVQRLLPAGKPLSSEACEFVKATLHLLMELDELEQINPLVTLSVNVGDGLWVYYEGRPEFLLKPTQKYILMHVFENTPLANVIDGLKTLFAVDVQRAYAHRMWRIQPPEMKWLAAYIKKQWASRDVLAQAADLEHPRNIPGAIREAALTSFIRGGRKCAGVDGIVKAHRITKAAPLEFDHILPYAKGGASTYWNVQVLCMDCNRRKHATAR